MNATSDPKCQPEIIQGLHELTVAVLSVSFVIGVVANALVLWMMAFRIPRSVTTIWFSNLAFADFMALLSLPITIHNVVTGQWLLTAAACKLYKAFLAISFFTSIWFLVLISLDRCISVIYPVWSRNHRTVRRGVCLAVCVWLLALVTCSPYLIFQDVEKQKGCEYCNFKFTTRAGNDAKEGKVAVTLIHILLGFLAPLVIISSCAHLIRTRLQQEGCARARRSKRLLLVLVSAFFACWFPFNTVLVARVWQRQAK